ncbi:MAG: hypothetical protein OHK0029_07200 [Armatimonadaceae bacterium]
MKRVNKISLMVSGGIIATGIVVGVIPLLEPVVTRVMNRASVVREEDTQGERAAVAMATSGFTSDAVLLESSRSIMPTGNPGSMMPVGSRSTVRTSIEITLGEAPDNAAPRFEVLDLTTLPDGANFAPTDINNNSVVVGNYRKVEAIGFSQRAPDGRRIATQFRVESYPAVFQNGVFTRLPLLPDSKWVTATDINDTGTVVGTARPISEVDIRGRLLPLEGQQPPQDLSPQVVRWSAGQITDLTPIFSAAQGFQRDRQRVGFSPNVPDRVRVSNDNVVYFGSENLYALRDGNVQQFEVSQLQSVNDNGVVVGYVPSPKTPQLEKLFSRGGRSLSPGEQIDRQPGILDTRTGTVQPLGRFSDEPVAINNQGGIVLRGYRAGGLVQLSFLKAGKASEMANVTLARQVLLNNNGWKVAGDGALDPPRSQREIQDIFSPLLWIGNKPYALKRLLPRPEEWVLSQPIALNDKNQILIFAYRVSELLKEEDNPEPGRRSRNVPRHALLLTPVGSSATQ